MNSIKDGKNHSFIWIKEEGSVPTPVYNGFVETTESNGITITVPLSESTKLNLSTLSSTMKDAANKALLGFLGHIMIVEDINKPYDQLVDITDKVITSKVALQTPDILIFNNSGSGYNLRSPFYVRVGTVTYPVPNNVNISVRSISNYIENINSLSIILDVPPSKLDIPMSREYLESTENNRKLITQAFDKFNDNIIKYYKSLDFDLTVSAFDFEEKVQKDESQNQNGSGIIWRVQLPYENMLENDATTVDLIKRSQQILRKSSTDYITPATYNHNTPASIFRNFYSMFLNEVGANTYNSYTNKLVTIDLWSSFKSFTHAVFVPVSLINIRTKILIEYLKFKYGFDDNSVEKVLIIKHKKEQQFSEKFYLDVLQEFSKKLNHKFLNLSNEKNIDKEINDLKEKAKKESVTKVTTENIPGVYVANFKNSVVHRYSSYSNDTYYTTTVDKPVKRLITGLGNTVHLGKSYFGDKSVLLVERKNRVALPLELDSIVDRLNTDSDKYDDLIILAVPKRSFDITKARLIKDGLTVYTEDNRYKIEIPTLEEHVQADKTEDNLLKLFNETLYLILSRRIALRQSKYSSEANTSINNLYKRIAVELSNYTDFELYSESLNIIAKDTDNKYLNQLHKSSHLGVDEKKCSEIEKIIDKFLIKVFLEESNSIPFEHNYLQHILSTLGFDTRLKINFVYS